MRIALIGASGHIGREIAREALRRGHTVTAITYRYEGRQGESRLLHFTVTDEGGLYELTYNTHDQTWQLRGIEVE